MLPGILASHLDVEELAGQEVHDMHIEVVVSGLGQQLAQKEDLPSTRQRRLLIRHAGLEQWPPPLVGTQTFLAGMTDAYQNKY